MLNVRQACAMLTPRLATASAAISLRKDGRATFFQALPSADHSACSSRHTSASGDGSLQPTPSSPTALTHPLSVMLTHNLPCNACRQTSPAIYKNWHCSFHPSRDLLRKPYGQRFAAQVRYWHTAFGLLQNTHNLRVAISFVLHLKSPQIICQENSTPEHQYF